LDSAVISLPQIKQRRIFTEQMTEGHFSVSGLSLKLGVYGAPTFRNSQVMAVEQVTSIVLTGFPLELLGQVTKSVTPAVQNLCETLKNLRKHGPKQHGFGLRMAAASKASKPSINQ
jgi:hypothetical protein